MTESPAGELAARVKFDAEVLDGQARLVDECFAAAMGGDPGWRDQAMELAGYRIAAYYAGLEHTLDLVARHFDFEPTSGPKSHRDLLDQMRRDRTGERPAVLPESTAAVLADVLEFRHVVRSAYSLELDLGRISPLRIPFNDLVPRVRADLLAFAEFLEGLGE